MGNKFYLPIIREVKLGLIKCASKLDDMIGGERAVEFISDLFVDLGMSDLEVADRDMDSMTHIHKGFGDGHIR